MRRCTSEQERKCIATDCTYTIYSLTRTLPIINEESRRTTQKNKKKKKYPAHHTFAHHLKTTDLLEYCTQTYIKMFGNGTGSHSFEFGGKNDCCTTELAKKKALM